ncbi:hypothetical protein B0H14DRAFT_3729123 [Mycena olivaceomarginata]|nr:hypothetical protein B0H14DRAFT_3729123 [Mycena olivaceomarginata]
MASLEDAETVCYIHGGTAGEDAKNHFILYYTSSHRPVQLSTRTQLNSWNPAVAEEATHESLMSNRNLQYIKLYDAHGNLLGRFQEAQQAYGELQIRYDTLNDAHSALVAAVSDRLSAPPCTHPASTDSSNALVPSSTSTDHLRILVQSDYRKINYWTEGVYRKEDKRRQSEKGKASMSDAKAQRGSKPLSEDDENVMFWFIEDEDGNSIPGQRAKAARDQARKIWRYLDRSGRLPDCWNEADTLCENDYKANRIATLIFPNFLKHCNSKVKEEIKEDSEDADNAAAAVVAGKKRAASEAPDDEPASKRTQCLRTHAPPAAPSATPEPVSVVVCIRTAGASTCHDSARTSFATSSSFATGTASTASADFTAFRSRCFLHNLHLLLPGVPSLPITTSVSAPPALALALLSSVAVASATGLSTGTNDNDLEPAIMDNISHHANTSGPPTAAVPVSATPQATVPAAGPSTSRVENPLAFLGDPKGPHDTSGIRGRNVGRWRLRRSPAHEVTRQDQQSGDSTKTVILHKSNAQNKRGGVTGFFL